MTEWGEFEDKVVEEQLEKISILEQLAPKLMLMAGAREQDGIFVTGDYLLENIQPPNYDIYNENLAGIKEFCDNNDVPTAVMLIPTAVAIKQQEIASTAQIFNQKQAISKANEELLGKAAVVDSYTALFSAAEQYTYYRTEGNLTGLGGYYLYSELCKKIGLNPMPISSFEVEHLSNNFYGSLHERSSFKGTKGDIITFYSSMDEKQYKVTHLTEQGLEKTYQTLYPTHLEDLESPLDVILGGVSPRIDITTSNAKRNRVLVIGDKTMTSYLPFLINHYNEVTFLDLTRLSPVILEGIDVQSYNNVIFGFSIDEFMTKPVSKTAGMIKGTKK